MLDIKKLKRIINENQDALILLEDYDTTGRLSRLKKKKRYNFTLDPKVMNGFRGYCKKNELVMSKEIEGLIKEKLSGKNKTYEIKK